MKPLIGIVSRSTRNDDSSIYYANSKVVRSIILCGGIPILIVPPHNFDYESDKPGNIERLNNETKEDLNRVLDMCDGVLMPGGNKWYEFDEYICKYALDNDIPLLGICMGMQLLAKRLNNSKIDGLDNTILNNTDINHNRPGEEYAHNVKIKKDSLLYEILNKEEINVNSRHNYHVPKELKYLETAYSSDGIIEAVDNKDSKFTLGVQWHPEVMCFYDDDAKKIIKAFIDKCKK